MKSVIFAGMLAIFMAVFAEAWSKLYDSDIDSWSLDRRSRANCVMSGGKCYASGQCCKGYVCAAFDDFYGLNPEIPGYCVREKDLEPCKGQEDCPSDRKCASLGRARGRFCVDAPEIEIENADRKLSSGNRFSAAKVTQGLAFPCTDDTDCAAYTKDGKDRLCCQDVRRYRQKTKRICDRVTPMSVCIGTKK